MKVYKDKISNDELFSDTYPITEVEDGLILKVQGKLTQEVTDVSQINTGANASEEDPGEQADGSSAQSGINVVLANRLVDVQFTKKTYQVYIKDYMKDLLKKLDSEDEKNDFKKKAQPFIKKILGEFKDYDFVQGESMNPEGMCALVTWEGETPYLLFFKHGLEEEKV